MEKFELKIGEKNLTVELNDLAGQASGSCFVRYGDTMVLATATMSEYDKEDLGFFPLTVDYEEKYYAAGKIRGPRYIKREGRPSDEAVCNARLIDRAIRPLFPKNLKREVQVIITVLSWDGENDPDILGLIGASAALSISNIPWQGPVGAVRIGKTEEGNLVLNPTYQERENNKMDLAITAVFDKEILINMLEGGFEEAGEKDVEDGFGLAKKPLQDIIDFQAGITKKAGKKKTVLPENPKDENLEKEIKNFLGNRLEKEIFSKDRALKGHGELKEETVNFVETKYQNEDKLKYAETFFDEEIERIVHKKTVEEDIRPDGRKPEELRKISCQVGLLPRTHGSGLFERGETKSLSILTLGAPGDRQLLEGMEIVGKKHFMHHYNFPPYSAGEVRPLRGPGRREIGHGMLAEKALLPLIPPYDDFPYTIRIVSEILSSNGSTSMASVSSSSLALMDAGVPIKRPATGISLGLMQDGEKYRILTDIQGPEDHHGDMDFKIAGTREGITAIQMDVKIKGITEKIFKEALERGKKVRYEILDKIEAILAKPRPELSPFAPRIVIIQINPDKIREVIGPGGKVINEIIEECGVSIDIEETGKIFVTAEKEDAAKKAVAWIENITREVKIGEVFQGKIKRILAFGAFAEILPGQEGLIHISQLAPWHVKQVEDVVKVGDVVPVKVISIDEQGRINLSLKEAKEHDEHNGAR